MKCFILSLLMLSSVSIKAQTDIWVTWGSTELYVLEADPSYAEFKSCAVSNANSNGTMAWQGLLDCLNNIAAPSSAVTAIINKLDYDGDGSLDDPGDSAFWLCGCSCITSDGYIRELGEVQCSVPFTCHGCCMDLESSSVCEEPGS